MEAGHLTSLLPEVFRHKTTRVRIFQPLVVLLDFHGTISERRWEDKVIFPYVKKAIVTYLKENWSNEITIQQSLPGLRNESFEQRFRYRYDDAPIIEDQESGLEGNQPLLLAEQMGEFLLWQMVTKRETKETHLIEWLVWQDGFRRRQIFLPLFDDVLPAIKKWHDNHSCEIHVISSTDSDTLKLLLENTDKGDLNQYISGYVNSKKQGDKLLVDTYKQFYEKFTQTRQKQCNKKDNLNLNLNSAKIPKHDSSLGQKNCLKSPQSQSSLSDFKNSSSSLRSVSKLSTSSDAARPMLFITDSGQEAKAASMVADGTAYECLLINRPGNRRIRTYYLSQFQYVSKFDDIEFVVQ